MYTDSHIHTAFSSDSETPVRMQIERAADLGMEAVYITDHQDFDFPGDIYGMSFRFDTQDYMKTILHLREEYRNRIEVRTGVELGLMTHLKDTLENYVSSWSFDYVIGSVHLVRKMDPYYPEFYEGRTSREAYLEYFETTLDNVRLHSCFDALGHLDYVVRYGPDAPSGYPSDDYRQVIDEILRILIQKGIALECNTAGLKYGLGFPNPHGDVIRRYVELGGEMVTLGSDGHQPAHVGYAFADIGNYLKSCGVRYQTVFRRRKPEFIPL
ncbi:MAG: histidinol-phosphatase HisJ family protein [Lachnospiraceae bacterium]|nr:histidinol-phosphatase HisJ family protein [Lachnospiraceae bacterium]